MGVTLHFALALILRIALIPLLLSPFVPYSFIFSLINGWHLEMTDFELPTFIEILQNLANTRPVDQPSLPVPELSRHKEEPYKADLIRSSFGKPVSSTLHSLSTLIELHIDKVPVVR